MSAEVQLGWNNDQLTAGARQAEGIVANASARMRGALSGIGSGLGAGLGFAVFDQAAGIVRGTASSLFDATLAADSMEGGMIALEGSIDAANARLAEMRQLAKDPGLGFAQVVQGDISLRSVGLSAGLATRAMREFGNALAVVGKGKAEMDGVLLAVTQIVSKGKVSAEEINQIAERVPQIRRVMMEAFGTADTEAIQKMGIPVERFIEMVVDGFERTVPRALVRMQGKIDNATDAMTARLADVGKGLSEGLMGPLDEATKRMEDGQKTAESFGASMGALASGALTAAGGITSLGKGILDGLGDLGMRLALAPSGGLEVYRQRMELAAAEAVRMKDAELAAARVASDLKRYQDQLAESTKRVADAHAEATKRANERGKAEAELTAKIIAATNAQRDRYLAEREKTADQLLTDEQKLEKVKERILAIDRDLNKVLGQTGGEDLAYQLSQEREKSMQELLRLSKAISDEQNRSNNTSQQQADEAARKVQDQQQALALYELETQIAEAQARGRDKLAEKLQRERDIIEETARLVEDMGLGYDEAFRKAERLVNAQARANDQNESGTRGATIYGYSQNQGSIGDAVNRADARREAARAEYEASVARWFGNTSTTPADGGAAPSSMFGPAPAEAAPNRAADLGSLRDLATSWSEWGSRTLEIFEKAFQ